MSSDDAYMSFLNKANADLHDSNRAQPPSTTQTRPAIHPDVKVPPSLTTLDTYYVSETDEPFEPVVLKWEGAKGGIWPGPCMSTNRLAGSLYYIGLYYAIT